MALTRCRECDQVVSTEAASCPHCGVPNPAVDLDAHSEEVRQEDERPDPGKRAVVRIAQLVGFVIAFLIARAAVDLIRSPRQFHLEQEYLEEMGMTSEAARVYSTEVNGWLEEYQSADAFCIDLSGARCKELFGSKGTSREGFEIGYLLGVERAWRGAARLGDSQIRQLAAMNGRLREGISVAECAAIARGDLDPSTYARLISRLDSIEIVRLVDLQRRAIEAEAADYPPAPVVTVAAEDSAWAAFLGLLPESDLKRAIAFFDSEEASDETECWFERMSWQSLPQLDERHAQVILWTMAEALGAGE